MVVRTRKTVILSALAWAPLVLVLGLWLVQLPDFGRLQYNDYYELLPKLADDEGHYSKNPLTYITLKSNEHTVAIPAFLYVVNAKLTAGDNRGLSVVSLVFLLASFVMLDRWTPEVWRRDPRLRFVVVAVLAVFALTPVAAHNVVRAFSGTIWLLANALAIGAMTALTRVDRGSPLWRLWPVVVIGVLGALSYSTTMSLWPAIVAGALLLGLDRRQVAVLVVAGVTVIGVYVSFVQTPGHHPEPDASHPLDLARYLSIYFGNILASDPHRAMAAGAVGLVLFAAVVVWTIRSAPGFRRLAAPWIMVGLYGLGNGLGTAVTRLGFGFEQALASRYATLSAFLWLCVLGVAALKVAEVGEPRTRKRWAVFVTSAAMVLAIVSLTHGAERLRTFVRVAGRQPPVELAMHYGIRDPEVLRSVSPDPAGPIRATPFFRNNGHIPFEKPFEVFYGKPLPGSLLERGSINVETRKNLTRLDETLARVEGWVRRPGTTAKRLLIADGSGIVCGEGRFISIPRFSAADDGPGSGRQRFIGWLKNDDPGEEMRIFVQFDDDESFHPVGKDFRTGD